LVYVYAFALACILQYSKKTIYKAGIALVCVITFMSFVRDMYAQKVWKLGFDAEMKAHERIVSRIEDHPYFYLLHLDSYLQILCGKLAMPCNAGLIYYYKRSFFEIPLL
jgi:hypothetical protein